MVEFCTYIETLGFPISIDIIIPYAGVDLSVFSWIGKTRITLFVALPYKKLEKNYRKPIYLQLTQFYRLGLNYKKRPQILAEFLKALQYCVIYETVPDEDCINIRDPHYSR